MSRRRYIVRRDEAGELQLVEVGGEWTDTPRSTGDLGKFQYDNLRATDGTDISSRTKRRDYMKARGVTDASDFAGEWARAAKEREAYAKAETVRPSMREAVGRAAHEAEKRRRR